MASTFNRFMFNLPLFGDRFLRWFGNGGRDAVAAPKNTLAVWVVMYDGGVQAIRSTVGWKMEDYKVKCFDVPCEADFGGGVYAWREALAGGSWVRGLYKKGQAFSALGPQGQICPGTMKHEVGGHHLLVTNKGDWTHNKLFDGVFSGWQESREVTGKGIALGCKSIGDGEDLIHFDVVEGEPVKIYHDYSARGVNILQVVEEQFRRASWGEAV